MSKKIIQIILNIISLLLVIMFFIKTYIDYTNYSITYSAPFSLWIKINIVLFIVPAIIIFIIEILIRKKK